MTLREKLLRNPFERTLTSMLVTKLDLVQIDTKLTLENNIIEAYESHNYDELVTQIRQYRKYNDYVEGNYDI